MSLSSTEEIKSAVKFDNNNFSFTNTYGSMIMNKPYEEGFVQFQNGEDSRDSFIYKALSATADDIGNELYLNVRKYIDFVSDVDVCKIKSLKSMMQIFGFKYTLFDSLQNIPHEVLNLVDVLSINKNKLFRSKILTNKFINDLISTDSKIAPAPVYYSDKQLDFKKYFANNSYIISVDSGCINSYDTDIQKLNGLYQFKGKKLSNIDELYETMSTSGYLDEQTYTKIKNIGLQDANIYYRNSGYFIAELSSNTNSYFDIYSNNFEKLISFTDENFLSIENELTANNKTLTFNISSLTCSNDQFDTVFRTKNIANKLDISLYNEEFNDNIECIDDEKYQEYIENIYHIFLKGQILAKYNAVFTVDKIPTEVYIYPYIGDMYYDSDKVITRDEFRNLGNDSDDYGILSAKMFNHIPKSFNEKKIVDNIENGLDSFENYQGVELDILNLERNRRAAELDFDKIGISGNISKKSQTRYSYYREKKVAEYANFIDQYNASIINNKKVYEFDTNYYELNPVDKKEIINHVLTKNDNGIIDPYVDVNDDMIKVVARYLANITQYICKIREKIKIQTQKNYMKGTNLLMIYIINEYLNEYVHYNKDFFKGNEYLEQIYENLNNHQFMDDDDNYLINIKEYWDQTEYFNLSTETSLKSDHGDKYVNDRYWEKTTDENLVPMRYDGLSYKLSTLEEFYLSVMNLRQTIGNKDTDLFNFLSTIYDLGANDTFVYNEKINDETLSVISTKLTNNKHAYELYKRLIDLSSAYTNLNKNYLSAGDHKYDSSTPISAQITSMTDDYIYNRLSNMYLSSVSAVYNTYYKHLVNLSDEYNSLKTEYNNFVDGTYKFYYEKTNCNYCYTGGIITDDNYKHDYYVGNSNYYVDDSTLYEKLNAIKRYSDNVENIKNHMIIDTVTYISGQFNEIYDTFETQVLNNISDEFTIIINENSNLDDDFDRTIAYLNTKLDDKISKVNSDISKIKNTIEELKTKYYDYQKQYTDLLSQMNFKNTASSPTAGQAIAVQVVKDGSSDLAKKIIQKVNASTYNANEIGRCDVFNTKQSTKVDGWTIDASEYITSTNFNSYSKLSSGKGDAVYLKYTCSPLTSNLSLYQCCQVLLQFISLPTHFTVNTSDKKNYSFNLQYYYQTKYETQVYPIINGLNSIKSQAENAIKDLDYQEIKDIDLSDMNNLEQNLINLYNVLNSIEESILKDDPEYNDLTSYIDKVTKLSCNTYIPLKNQYLNIFDNMDQSDYLSKFTAQSQITKYNMSKLLDYTEKTDASNYESIKNQINEFLNERIKEIFDDKTELEINMKNDNVNGIHLSQGYNFEQIFEDINYVLVNDLETKIAKGKKLVTDHMTIVNKYVNTIKQEIYSNLNSCFDFDLVVKNKLSELNFFEQSLYNNWKDVFLTYGGRSYCYDPYYNMKNTTHPSYQVHPFLWNCLLKLENQTLLTKGFKSSTVDDLIDGKSLENIKKYVGEFGQSINDLQMYKSGITDYSGYSTRWETSQHLSPVTGIENMLVDFDGSFYMPAVEDFKENKDFCIKSVADGISKNTVINLINERLSDDLTSYVDYDITNGKITNYNLLSSIICGVFDYSYFDNAEIFEKLNTFITKSDTNITSITIDDVKKLISDNINETFYEKYYSHLNLPQSQRSFVASQLEEYGDLILEHTEDKEIWKQYDIYKYGLDEFKNSYILFKKYDCNEKTYSKLSYKMKRDTLGDMWIRLAHTPFAFPAFSGSHPQYAMDKISHVSKAIQKLADMEKSIEYTDREQTIISNINTEAKWFYDFEFSQDKGSISYITFNAKLPYNHKFYKQYDFAWVVSDNISLTYDVDTDIERLLFNNDTNNNIDYIDFDPEDSMFQAYRATNEKGKRLIDINTNDGIVYPALIGNYVYDNQCIDFAYVYKKYSKYGEHFISEICDENGDTSKAKAFIIKVHDGLDTSAIPASDGFELKLSENKIPYGGQVCVAYDKNSQKTVFALTTMNIKTINGVDVESSINKLHLDVNSTGATFDDPIAPEMNSHDIFNQNITIVSFKHKKKKFTYVGDEDYNTNADMSYIPSYPGHDHKNYVYRKDGYMTSDLFCNIELLGMSKDLDDLFNMVNPNPNPYYTPGDNDEFQRVYEDYDPSENKSFNFLENPSLNSNMTFGQENENQIYSVDKVDIDGGISYYQLSYNIRNINSNFTDHDYNTLRVIVYNKNSLGKNPYFIGQLGNITEESDVYYNESLNSENIAESDIIVGNNGGYRVTVTGTHDYIGRQWSMTDSNNIENINKITMWFDAVNKKLIFKFYFETEKSETFVPSGDIKIAFLNINDMSIFKYYHMLDAYGVVNCKHVLSQITDERDIEFDGWKLYYDKSQHDPNTIYELMKSFYYDDIGEKTNLENVDLSKYNALSDVYILKGNNRLSFKNDEEIIFDITNDMYYYPTLNINYPKNPAWYIEKKMTFSSIHGVGDLSSVFTEYNTFILECDNCELLAKNFGAISIPIKYKEVYDMRAFEDYLWGDNYKKYDWTDSRILQYIHFVTLGENNNAFPAEYTDTNPYVLPESYWKNKTSEKCVELMNQMKYKWEVRCSEDSYDTYKTEYITIPGTKIDPTGIKGFLNLHVLYKRDRDLNGIKLYFNPQNYLDSPYIKIENGNELKVDTIPGTYLRLNPGEDGLIDIVLQFRYYVGGKLNGYKNVKILTYHAYNISDDKPKFLLQKIYEISKDEYQTIIDDGYIGIDMKLDDINLNGLSNNRYINNIKMSITVNRSIDLKSNYKFKVHYPASILSFESSLTRGCTAESSDNGIIQLTVNDPNIRNINLKFKTRKTVGELKTYDGYQYTISTYDDNITSSTGRYCHVVHGRSSFMITT